MTVFNLHFWVSSISRWMLTSGSKFCTTLSIFASEYFLHKKNTKYCKKQGITWWHNMIFTPHLSIQYTVYRYIYIYDPTVIHSWKHFKIHTTSFYHLPQPRMWNFLMFHPSLHDRNWSYLLSTYRRTWWLWFECSTSSLLLVKRKTS